MKIIKQDILSVTSGIIVQSINCIGGMGGLAGAIARKYPVVKETYLKVLDRVNIKHRFTFLGQVLYVDASDSLTFANVFGQWHTSGSERMTDYAAIAAGLKTIAENNADAKQPVYIPYLLGCGLGGGDWNLVSEMIDYYLPDAIIYQL